MIQYFGGYDFFQCLLRSVHKFGRSNVNSSTRPEGQPRPITDSDTAEVRARYSGGNHSRFSEFQVIHVPSEVILSFKSLLSCIDLMNSGDLAVIQC